MEKNKELIDFQKQQAIDCFNKTWDYIDMENRTKEDDFQMIHCAHTSRYLWSLVGNPVNIERGEWQVSKVYSIVGLGQSALYHGEECLRICLENDVEIFDLVFAYECIARAYKILNDTENLEKYIKLANETLEKMEKNSDYDYAKSEIDSI